MRYFLPLLFSLTLMGCPSSLGELIDVPLSNADIALGLKEALNLGTDEAVDVLSIKDGFYKSIYKIYLPEEASTITNKLKFIPGFSNVEDVILEKINRAAEDAAGNVGPVFLNAIKGMSINDALGILMGERDSATRYLESNTQSELYDKFQPIIVASLNKFNAVQYWEDAVNKYNNIPLIGGNVNPRIDDHVTLAALTGLFSLIEQKEDGIRTDATQRISPLLQKVFEKQDPS